MRNIRWQLLIAIGGVLLVVGLLIGQAPPPLVSPSQPVPGGAYSEGVVGSISRLNPILDAFNQVDRDVDRLIYSGLVRFDSRGIPQPDLAESWSVSADATLYTFTMREDAIWHDGQPVTADDVIFTFSKFQDSDYPGAEDLQAFWQQIQVIRLDSHTVQFQLPESYSPFLDYLAVGLLPDHLLRGVSASAMIDHPFNLEPIGTGPFQFETFLVEDDAIIGVSLVAFAQHYGKRPYLERVEIRTFTTHEAALDAYNAGAIQGLGEVTPELFGEVLADPQLNLHTSRRPQVGVVLLNTRHPELTFFAEKQVRQALLLSVNRQWLIDYAFAGQAVVADSPILPGVWAHSDALEPVAYDPNLASDLLDSLGWEIPAGAAPNSPEYLRALDDQFLAFELVIPDDPAFVRIAEILVQSWASIGVQAEVNPVDPDLIVTDYLEPREFHAVLTEINLAGFPDPDPYPFWHDSQIETGQNYSGFSDRNVSIWLEQARTNPDVSRRMELYRSFQYRFRDQVPSLLLYHPVYSFAIDTKVQGVTLGPIQDPSDRFANIMDWHLLVRRSVEATNESSSTE
ncbi:MAG: peptide ABC transporter substrate-binding protein [Anaerolineales bacterium]|jgi:peptide/nickel transport system substrate-binding protein